MWIATILHSATASWDCSWSGAFCSVAIGDSHCTLLDSYPQSNTQCRSLMPCRHPYYDKCLMVVPELGHVMPHKLGLYGRSRPEELTILGLLIDLCGKSSKKWLDWSLLSKFLSFGPSWAHENFVDSSNKMAQDGPLSMPHDQLLPSSLL